jgi:hypothetical protein
MGQAPRADGAFAVIGKAFNIWCPEPEIRQQMGSNPGRTSGSTRTPESILFSGVASDSEIRTPPPSSTGEFLNRHASALPGRILTDTGVVRPWSRFGS